jgi:hypothetical protein
LGGSTGAAKKILRGTDGSNPSPSSEESSANQVPSARPPWYTIAPAISSSLLGAGHRRCVCPYHPRRRFRFAYRPGYFDRLFEPHRQETFTFHRQELTVRGAQGAAKELVELSVPAKYRWVPDGLPGDSPLQRRAALRPLGGKHPRRQAGEPELRGGGNAPPPVGRDHASLGNRAEAGALTSSQNAAMAGDDHQLVPGVIVPPPPRPLPVSD